MTVLHIARYRRGGPAQTTTTDNPSLQEVTRAIASLDGHAEIELLDTRSWLAIAGVPDRLFVGYVNDDDQQILQALADSPSGETLELMVGGQPTELLSTYLVPTAVARTAALHFLATGQASPEITWDRM